MTQELKALVEAHDMLDEKTKELLHGPMAFFAMVLHARDHVNTEIKAYLREEQKPEGEGFCDICQKQEPTKFIGGVNVCFLHVSEAEWEAGRLSSEVALYTNDGEGREIPGGPVTLAEACEAGIALFE